MSVFDITKNQIKIINNFDLKFLKSFLFILKPPTLHLPQVQTQLKQKQVKLDINLDDFDPKTGFKKWITEEEKQEVREELKKSRKWLSWFFKK